MTHPFQLTPEELNDRMEEMVDVTFADLQSQFLMLPKGQGFIEYPDFQAAYEVLKRRTGAFANFTATTVWNALREDALALVVLRTILGFSPPEWAEVARAETEVDVTTNAARTLDTAVRQSRKMLEHANVAEDLHSKRVNALVEVAIKYITREAPAAAGDTVYRLGKVDTAEGLVSLQHAANYHVPYATLLYERYLGRPFASHRDSVSELVGDVMESAIEARLSRIPISYRKTKRAERVPGFEQAPDFIVPEERNPSVIIEAKIASDDGTARDKITRMLRLAMMRDERARAKKPTFEVVACVDGRGFGVRRQDMRDMLRATNGKVFTLATLDQIVEHTRLQDFMPEGARP